MAAREHAAPGSVIADPPPRSLGPPPSRFAPPRTFSWPTPRRSPFLYATIVCVALAALSAAVLPTVPSYDPWSWIVWGREVFDPHLSFTVGGGPSWKPLPVIFTAIYGLFGGAAPVLWVITARAGGLLALVAAWRLAARLTAAFAGDPADPVARAVPAIAGVVAVFGVLGTQDFFYYWFRGTSEPMLIATALWAVDRFLEGRRAQAFVFAVAGSLIRPEWWPFLGLYGLWLWFAHPRLRGLVVAGFAAVPFFWFVPPWIGTGQPFIAATHAKEYNGHLGSHPELEALRRAADLQVLPSLIAAAIAVAWTWLRERDRTVLGLAAAALAWTALVVVMVADGYPGLERFFLPAAAIICVLGGVAFARVAAAIGRAVAAGRPSAAFIVATVVAAGLVAISIPLAGSRIDAARAARPTAGQAVSILDQLSGAVAAVGGRDHLLPCPSSLVAINHGVQTALAWKLHATLERVDTVLRHPGVVFVGPHNSIDGGPAPVSARLTVHRTLARVGVWRVVALTRPGDRLNACVGR